MMAIEGSVDTGGKSDVGQQQSNNEGILNPYFISNSDNPTSLQ